MMMTGGRDKGGGKISRRNHKHTVGRVRRSNIFGIFSHNHSQAARNENVQLCALQAHFWGTSPITSPLLEKENSRFEMLKIPRKGANIMVSFSFHGKSQKYNTPSQCDSAVSGKKLVQYKWTKTSWKFEKLTKNQGPGLSVVNRIVTYQSMMDTFTFGIKKDFG